MTPCRAMLRPSYFQAPGLSIKRRPRSQPMRPTGIVSSKTMGLTELKFRKGHELLAAPFHYPSLVDWRFVVPLALRAAKSATGYDKPPNGARQRFFARDAAMTTVTSYSAGVGEEAVFRGWMIS